MTENEHSVGDGLRSVPHTDSLVGDGAQSVPHTDSAPTLRLRGVGRRFGGLLAVRDVDLDVKVDPSIIGGLIVKVGSRMVDSSLRTKLNSIKLAMKEAR